MSIARISFKGIANRPLACKFKGLQVNFRVNLRIRRAKKH